MIKLILYVPSRDTLVSNIPLVFSGDNLGMIWTSMFLAFTLGELHLASSLVETLFSGNTSANFGGSNWAKKLPHFLKFGFYGILHDHKLYQIHINSEDFW